jgi:hypothetical protein
MTTLLSPASRIDGEKSLVRNVPQSNGEMRKVDLWGEVVSVDSKYLESIMNLASTDADYSLLDFITGIEYQGFNREFYIKFALSKMSVSTFARFAVLGAVRGSNFKKVIDTCEKMPQDLVNSYDSLGFVRTPKKKVDLTVLRCTTSIPHWCAYWMQTSSQPPKVQGSNCPAALQFPAAASLPMSREVRMAHLDFCLKFSSLLPKGAFNFNIYRTAMNNAIEVSMIPNVVLALLGVKADSESHVLTEKEVEAYSTQLVKV